MKQKVVCVWIGKFESEADLRERYLEIDYDDADINSQFGADANLEFYDGDFMESWWFEKLSVAQITAKRNTLLEENYFFDDLINVLENRNLDGKNAIIFMFGEYSAFPTNEDLFDYNAALAGKPIEFVFKKEYTV